MTNKINKPVSHTIYYENWLMKKEGVKSWESYYGLIRGKWLQFYEKNSTNEKLELRKTLELPPKTQCSIVKRTKRRFPFSINNGMGTYYMKCDSELERYHWIFSILSAALSKDKKSLPQTIPESMKEKEAFKKGMSKENHEPKSSGSNSTTPSTSPTKQLSNASDFTNKRRQKYAIRNEIRMKRKANKRAKKLGLEPEYSEESMKMTIATTTNMAAAQQAEKQSVEKSKNQQDIPNVLRRTKNVRHSREEDPTTVTRLRSFSEISFATASDGEEIDYNNKRLTKARQKFKNEKERNNNNALTSMTVEGLPSTAIEVKALLNPKQPKRSIGDKNYAFENDSFEESPSVIIQMLDDSDELLPNVIRYDDEDDDDDYSPPSTADTSITSTTGSFLSLSNASNNNLSVSGTSLQNVTTRTYLSDTDYEQKTFSGDVISSTDPNRPSLRPINGRPSSRNGGSRPGSRPGSSAGTRKMSNNNRPTSLLMPDSLIDRPLTPSHSRPLTPNKSPKHFSRFLVNDGTSIA